VSAEGVPTDEAGKPPVQEATEEEEQPGRPGRPKGPEAKIEILDASGKVIRTLRQPAVQGLNRAVWNLRRDTFKRIPRKNANPFFEASGPDVLPGTYTVRVSYKDQKAEGKVNVGSDPRMDRLTPEGREANYRALERAGHIQEALAAAVERINQARSDIDSSLAKVRAREKKEDEGEKPSSALAKQARDLKAKLDAIERRLWTPEGTKGEQPDNDAEAKVNYAARSLGTSWDAPTPAQLAYLDQAEKQARDTLEDLNRLFAGDVAAFRAKVRELDVQLLPDLPPLKIEE
jgi:hypothetical protein